MTTGEGGIVATDNEDYARRIRLMRLHGINRDVWDRYTNGAGSWEYDVVAPGYKYNMPDLNAAVGLAQFERLDEMHAARVRCANRYLERLAVLEQQIELPGVPPVMSDHSWHLFPIKVKPSAGLLRNDVFEQLKCAGIGTSVHYKPLHQLSYYKEKYRLTVDNFPGAEAMWQQTLSLPIYNTLTEAEVDYVCDSLIELSWQGLTASAAAIPA